MGRKIGMTQLFTEAGNVVPVTVVECGPLRCCAEEDDRHRRIRCRTARF